MIEFATATEFVRRATQGRTGPLIMVCETEANETVELFCKISAGCDEGVTNLAREAFSACLAADLNLPVPKPYFVRIPPELCSVITEQSVAARMLGSVPVAFGSTKVQNQFSAWTTGNRVSDELLPTAAATLVFDGIIQNPDRRDGNPNCLIKGNEIRLIDHELALTHGVVLNWKPPWSVLGLASFEMPGNHIFQSPLRGRDIDFTPIEAAWSGLSDARLGEYQNTIPIEWVTAQTDINDAVRLIADARDNIESCITEVRRILS